MEILNFNNPQVWKEQERAAYDGTVKYEKFPAAEYKYFAELMKLYEEFRFGGLDRSLAEQKKAKLFAEYRENTAEHERYLDVYRNYQENIRTAGSLLSDIEKSQSPEEIALLACQCIQLLTGEAEFLKRQKRKILKEEQL